MLPRQIIFMHACVKTHFTRIMCPDGCKCQWKVGLTDNSWRRRWILTAFWRRLKNNLTSFGAKMVIKWPVIPIWWAPWQRQNDRPTIGKSKFPQRMKKQVLIVSAPKDKSYFQNFEKKLDRRGVGIHAPRTPLVRARVGGFGQLSFSGFLRGLV